MLKNQKGITLIALIITIIVMLILVGVTINVALNGGLFSKAEEATTKTKIAQIQEELTIKKAEILAEYDGKIPDDYGITIDHLNLPTEIKAQYRSKLVISKDAILYYDASVVTNIEEQNLYKSMGIQEYTENINGGEIPEFYGVAYGAEVEGGTLKFYFLENNIALQRIEDGYGAVKYTKNGNEINFLGRTAIISEDYKTIGIMGNTITKNENDIYEYNPIYDKDNNVFLEGFYLDETGEILFISGGYVHDGSGAGRDMSDFLSNSQRSEEGKQITYNEKVYILVEEI